MPRAAWTSDRTIRIEPRDATPTQVLAARLRSTSPIAGVLDCVPSAMSVMVVVDPLAIDPEMLSTLPAKLDECAHEERTTDAGRADEPRTVIIPACYDPRCAPDLDAVSTSLGLSAVDIAERHASMVYTVECVGFSPGFAYLAGLDAALHLPRKATPIPRVLPGSIGVAGDTTGIYPHATAGGWHLIGRTAEPLFDPAADPPARLRVGDRVRFEPISYERFQRNQRASR